MIKLLCEIAVIGAGLAGLAAADFLTSHGYDVKLIEAENRVGRRALTHYLPDGTHFELGSFSFGDGEQPLWDYIHTWSEGYCYFPANMNTLQNALRKIEGRIHFAGEHTNAQFASMHGFIESGIRAGKEIIKAESMHRS